MLRSFLLPLHRLIMPRKRSGGFYAVKSGRRTGVFLSWGECELLVKGFPGAKYKKFSTIAEAEEFAGCAPASSRNGDSGYSDSSDKCSIPKAANDSITTHTVQDDGLSNELRSSRKRSHEDDTPIPVVYTDGACSGNGKRGAKAGIGVWWGDGDPRNVSEPLDGKPTNNRAEIQAAARAIQQAKDQGFKKVEIRTDSNFLVESVTKRIAGWKRRGWKRTTGEPVINKDDFEDLLKASKNIDVEWTHVRGHIGIHGNEMADGLATSGMLKRKKMDDET